MDMENRSKFYGLNRRGNEIKNPEEEKKWSNDDFDKRYQRVKKVINAYKDGALDKTDLKFVIKNAFVSKVYISVKAKGILDNVKRNSLSKLYEKLIKEKVLKLYNKDNDTFQPYFDICKLAERTSDIIIEHVIPADVYLNDCVLEKMLDKDSFKKVFDAVSICLITKDQDNLLNQKKLKSKMPNGYNDFSSFINHPFARYDQSLEGVNIEIHGKTMKKGILSNNHKEKSMAI